MNLKDYTYLNKAVTFDNGKTFSLYSKDTKRGIRYFFWSPSNHRMMPIAKSKIDLT